MKLIFVAKKALDAYFISSALSRSVTSMGVSLRFKGRYNSVSNAFARSLSTPNTTLSGLIKSEIAAPSLKNSGLDATSKSAVALVSVMS